MSGVINIKRKVNLKGMYGKEEYKAKVGWSR
jgi:hypothetical protein